MKAKYFIPVLTLLLLTIGVNAQKIIDASLVPKSAINMADKWFPKASNVAWFTDKNDENVFDVFGKKHFVFEMHLDASGKILFLKTKFDGADDSIFMVPVDIIRNFESTYPTAEDVIWSKGYDGCSEDMEPGHYHAHIATKTDSLMDEITFDSLANIISYGYSAKAIMSNLPDRGAQYVSRHYKNTNGIVLGGEALFESNQIKTYKVHIHDGKHYFDYVFDSNGNFIKEEKKLKPPPKNPFE